MLHSGIWSRVWAKISKGCVTPLKYSFLDVCPPLLFIHCIFTSENIIFNVVSKATMKIFSFLIVRKVEIINIRRKVQMTNYPLE